MASAIDLRARLISIFPGLATTHFEITSPYDEDYNCIAWAAGEQGFWWWPGRFWPKDVPPAETRLAFSRAFATKGYVECSNPDLEAGYEKVCLYEKLGRPKHAARQLQSGLWTSKLGMEHDISHELDGLSGKQYGKPVLFMKRELPAELDEAVL
jgi:hypothetical protein